MLLSSEEGIEVVAVRYKEGTAIATVVSEPTGRDVDGPRFVAVLSPRPIAETLRRRLRMIAAIAAQGFDLCAARQRPKHYDMRHVGMNMVGDLAAPRNTPIRATAAPPIPSPAAPLCELPGYRTFGRAQAAVTPHPEHTAS